MRWYPDHLSEQDASEALASKLVKLKRSGGRTPPMKLDKHSYDSRPEDYWKAAASLSKVVVFGLQAKASGMYVPNEVVAEYVAQHPEQQEGWASVDPNEANCIEQLEHCVKTLGLSGLSWRESVSTSIPGIASTGLFPEVPGTGIADRWHQGTTFPSAAQLVGPAAATR